MVHIGQTLVAASSYANLMNIILALFFFMYSGVGYIHKDEEDVVLPVHREIGETAAWDARELFICWELGSHW